MQLSPSFRGVVLSLIFAGVNAICFNGRSQYLPSGGQVAVPAALAGAQTDSRAAINASGGFLVWDDNAADKDGLGIRASALDQNLLPVGASFRVNKSGARDQDHPCVVLPPGGGAVFVWESGRPGFQRICARFLSTSNTWLTTDVFVSTNSNPQSTPTAAVLDNGNIVVVWASMNQAALGSMKDVFGQVFTPAGQKVGAQFQVNTFTSYNQRSPAIAALNNGQFLVAWVSEQQRFGGANAAPASNFTFTNSAGGQQVVPLIASCQR
jgi:hypothetical protein